MNERPLGERVDLAIRWYWANLSEIHALLPLKIHHQSFDPEDYTISLYVAHWNPEKWFQRWDDGKLSPEEAEEKICNQIRPLAKYFQQLRQSTSVDSDGQNPPPLRSPQPTP